MPSISSSRESGIAFATALPPAAGSSLSDFPWMTSVGAAHLAQLRGPVAGLHDRHQLMGGAGGVEAAVVAEQRAAAQALGVVREARGADPLEQGGDVGGVGLTLRRRAGEERADHAHPRQRRRRRGRRGRT